MVLVWMIPSQSRAADGQREKAKVEMLPCCPMFCSVSWDSGRALGHAVGFSVCHAFLPGVPGSRALTGTQTVCCLSRVGAFGVDHFAGWCFLLCAPVDPRGVGRAVSGAGRQDFWLELDYVRGDGPIGGWCSFMLPGELLGSGM